MSPLRAGMTLSPTRVRIEQGPVAVFAGVLGAGEVHRSAAAATDAGFEGVPVPPTYGFVMAHWGAHPDLQTGATGDLAGLAAVSSALAENGGMVLHGEQEFTYHRPLLVGETVDVTGVVLDVVDKAGSGGRSLRMARVQLEARGPDGAPALTQVMTLICRS